MSDVLLREAKPEDTPAIAGLMGQLGYPQTEAESAECLAAYASAGSFVLVAEAGGQVAGFISFHAIPLFHQLGNLGRITAMCVSSAHRRSGIGGLLLQAAEQRAKELGCARIEVFSGDRRASEAHLFYEKHGYHTDCRRFLRRMD